MATAPLFSSLTGWNQPGKLRKWAGNVEYSTHNVFYPKSLPQRTKEIGIRKVLGASVTGIAVMLAKEFVILIILAMVIASPIAYYLIHQWLQGFAYRVNFSWWIFLSSGMSAILIAMLTVGYQSIKAAIANPVKSLRTE